LEVLIPSPQQFVSDNYAIEALIGLDSLLGVGILIGPNFAVAGAFCFVMR
jgi:hypothetical protein